MEISKNFIKTSYVANKYILRVTRCHKNYSIFQKMETNDSFRKILVDFMFYPYQNNPLRLFL